MLKSPLDSILFISLPENFELPQNAFQIDVSIPLPVQCEGDTQNFDMADLAWEMILAGVLTVLAYDSEHEHIDYYRSLLFSVRPNIKVELSEAAILKVRNDDYDIAEEIFDALRGLDPADMAVVLNTALFFDQKAEYFRKSQLFEEADAYDESAFQYYKQVMEAEPPIPDAFFNAGFFYLKQKNFAKARQVLETYLSLMSAEAELDENAAYKKERAQEIVDDIAVRNLDDELFKSAFDFISMGEEEKGLGLIHQFLQNNPKVWNAWFMLGWALRRLNRWEDAYAAFMQACSCGGENTDTCNEMAICLMEMQEYEKAKIQLVKALQLEPENTKVMSNLGVLALKMGNHSEARSYFLTVLEFDPNDELAKTALEELDA